MAAVANQTITLPESWPSIPLFILSKDDLMDNVWFRKKFMVRFVCTMNSSPEMAVYRSTNAFLYYLLQMSYW